MPFTNNMGRRTGPTKRWAWSLIHIVWYPASVFAEYWFYCLGLLELCGYINFVIFTNCPRTFRGHCMIEFVMTVIFRFLCKYHIYLLFFHNNTTSYGIMHTEVEHCKMKVDLIFPLFAGAHINLLWTDLSKNKSVFLNGDVWAGMRCCQRHRAFMKRMMVFKDF